MWQGGKASIQSRCRSIVGIMTFLEKRGQSGERIVFVGSEEPKHMPQRWTKVPDWVVLGLWPTMYYPGTGPDEESSRGACLVGWGERYDLLDLHETSFFGVDDFLDGMDGPSLTSSSREELIDVMAGGEWCISLGREDVDTILAGAIACGVLELTNREIAKIAARGSEIMRQAVLRWSVAGRKTGRN